jgi:hypothetical protein
MLKILLLIEREVSAVSGLIIRLLSASGSEQSQWKKREEMAKPNVYRQCGVDYSGEF